MDFTTLSLAEIGAGLDAVGRDSQVAAVCCCAVM
jgi:hypothetical protein